MIEDLLPIGLLIVVARLLECLLDRIGLISIVAYTAAAILLVPVAGIVEPTSKLQVFLGIGVFILFFLADLDEIDFPGVAATIRGRFFYVTFLGAVTGIASPAWLTSVPSNSFFSQAFPADHRPASCRTLERSGILIQ